ncbi:hypothetical protein [Roseovarius sp. MBR-6]|uniref:hypothetical protein n=1 Tax=Roseovarius sp. MBR-6 TaxID=3156459 RepID=UPI0033964A89
MERAETCLDAPSRATLAEIVDGFIATHAGPQDFTPQELAHVRKIGTEPFVPADPQALTSLFGRRG